VFNNPLLDEIKADIVKAGVGGAVGGLVVGLLAMYLIMRNRRPTPLREPSR
jgi:hypothetical protein